MKKIIFLLSFSILFVKLAFGQINIMADKSIGVNTNGNSFAGLTIDNIPTTQNNGILLNFKQGILGPAVALRTILKRTVPTSGSMKGLTFEVDNSDCNTPGCNAYDIIGIENEFTNLATTGKITAFRNAWQKPAGNTTSCYGIENIFTFSGTAIDYGVSQVITVNNSSTYTTPVNYKYGFYNKFINTATIPLASRIPVIGVYSSLDTTMFHPNSAAAQFEGRLVLKGAFIQSSDKNLKDNIVDLTNAMDLVKKLSPKNYNVIAEAPVIKAGQNVKKKHYGLIAQDVEQIIPDIVEEFDVPKTTTKIVKEKVQKTKIVKDANGNDTTVTYTEDIDKQVNEITGYTKYKGINYTELIAVLMQALKEQQAVIETLQTDVEILKIKVK